MKTLSQQTTMWVALIALLRLPLSTGYNNGAPEESCQSLLPRHDNATAMTTPSPFAINVSATSFRPGDVIHVTLTASDTQPFKGFLIQAVRVSAPDNNNVAIGMLTSPSSNATQTLCVTDMGNGLTHVINDDKTIVSCQWRAPSQPVENIVFKATFVVAFNEFWVDVRSSEIRSLSPPAPTSSATAPSSLVKHCILGLQLRAASAINMVVVIFIALVYAEIF